MNIKLKKKIAGMLTGLMVFQIAFFGFNANSSLAYAETGLEKTSLSISYDSLASVPVGSYFTNSVTVKGDVLADAKGDNVRFYAVVNRVDDLTVNTADVTIDPIPGAGAPAVIYTASSERGHVTASERSLVLAWGPTGGFKMTDAYVDAYKVGVTNEFKTKVNKIGKYSISYTFFDLTKSKVIGNSLEDQNLNITPTSIVTSYKEATKSVVSNKEFTNTVTLKGETLGDAFGSQARGYVVITRVDKTEEPVLSSDVKVTLNGISGVVLVSSEELKEVSQGNSNSLILGWDPFTLTNNFSAGVTSDFKVTFLKDGVYKFQNVIYYEDVEHLQGGFYANATPNDEGNVITVDTVEPKVDVVTSPKYVTDLAKPVYFTFTANEPVLIKNVTFKKGDVTLAVFELFSITDKDMPELTKLATLNEDALTEKGTYSVDVEYTAVDEAGNEAKLKTQINVDTEAPDAVIGFTGKVDTDGNVVLTWKNPVPNDYHKIEVYRDGVLLKTLQGADATFTDKTAIKGVAYKYDVVAYDAAGNYIHASQPVSVTVPVPAPVVVVPTPAANEIASADPTTISEAPKTEQDVKSESSENETEDTKANNLPIWGIILLIILAGVGGYLFLTQKPTDEVVTTRTEPIKPKSKKKK